jgi:REP element-mobilizing transposase RayT
MAQNKIHLKSGRTYHIWTHANGAENLFRTEENYHYFLKKYQYHVHPVVDTFAYCLMPNHLHLMVRIKSEKDVLEFIRKRKEEPDLTLQGFETLGGLSSIISRQFSHLFNGYTQAYNKRYDRKGSLFIPNFRRKLIDSDEYFVRLIAYIHNNPVHHGFTKKLNDWPFNSWHAYVLDKLTNINKEEAMEWFGGLDNFKTIHQETIFLKSRTLFQD